MYVEFELFDENNQRISLHEDNVLYIKQDGVTLTPNTDHTLWFKKDKSNGDYTFEIKTIDGVVYVAVLNWTN